MVVGPVIPNESCSDVPFTLLQRESHRCLEADRPDASSEQSPSVTFERRTQALKLFHNTAYD